MPAIHAAVTRTAVTKRARKTALEPWRAKKRSPTTFEETLAVSLQTAGALQQSAPTAAPKQEADVVSRDRGDGGDGNHDWESEMTLVGEHGRRQQCGLAGQRQAHRLSPDESCKRQVRGRAAQGAERKGSRHMTTAPTAYAA
jgi:hypothetical protein